MMPRSFWIPTALLCLSCAEVPVEPPRTAVPIKSACTARSRAPSSVGLDVRRGRRHSQADTIFVTNLSDRPRTLRVQQVARVEGPCSGEWSQQAQLRFVNAATRRPPGQVTLQPSRRMELRSGPPRVGATWSCTKLGMALWLELDDELVCADVGSWVVERAPQKANDE